VKGGLLDVLSSRDLPDDRRGIFHPEIFTFGEAVYLSSVFAAAQAVPGVDSVSVSRFRRLERKNLPKFAPTKKFPPLVSGFGQKILPFDAARKRRLHSLVESELSMSRLEIARLDNDRNFPEHGVVRLEMQGGK
jgi:hypothetical protein